MKIEQEAFDKLDKLDRIEYISRISRSERLETEPLLILLFLLSALIILCGCSMNAEGSLKDNVGLIILMGVIFVVIVLTIMIDRITTKRDLDFIDNEFFGVKSKKRK